MLQHALLEHGLSSRPRSRVQLGAGPQHVHGMAYGRPTVQELRDDGPLAPIWRSASDGGDSRPLADLMPRPDEPARLEWALGRQWRDGRFNLRDDLPVWDSEGRLLNPPRPLEDPYDLPAGRREAA